ncbi:MAG: type II toxin-antitoxin system VapC family toxin [Acidobacteriaceae bacterium]|nr:type II toxin-antitoxin system VapC family toxin [Acidobacteriaceae bacterium]
MGVIYLLDTNVISERSRAQPAKEVISFLQSLPLESIYLSVLTVGELRKGALKIERTNPAKSAELNHWIDGLESQFASRILGIDQRIARLWGTWSAQRSRPIVDTLLAATASVQGLVFVTRNESDVADLPVRVINPWSR